MTRTHRNVVNLVSLVVVCLSFLSGAFVCVAHAERNIISIQGGLFEPWNGNAGSSLAFQYARKLGVRHYVGAEFEYRTFEGELFDVDLDLDTYHLRAIYRIDLIADSIITPYLGVGLGLAVNTFSDSKVERVLEARFPGSSASVSSVGAGIGVLGMVGLDAKIPLIPRLSVFSEARFGYSAQFSQIETTSAGGDDDELDVDNLGGITVHGGLRFSF